MSPPATQQSPLTVQFRTSYFELCRALHAINSVRRPVRIIRGVAWTALIAAIVAGVTSGASAEIAVLLLIFAGMCFAILLTVPVYGAWLTRRSSPLWTGDLEFTFTEGGVRGTALASAGFTRWDAVIRVAETRRFVLFFTSDYCAYFIPKRALSDAAAVSSLVSMLRERAGKRGLAEAEVEGPEIPFSGPSRVSSTFEWHTREMARAMIEMARRGPSLWPWYLIIGGIVIWTTVPRAYDQWRNGGWAAVSVTDLVTGLLPLLILIAAIRLSAWLFAYRHRRTGPSTAGPQTVALYDEGLIVRGAMYTGSFRWTALVKAVETSEFFLFFVSKIQGVYLPKRTLSVNDIEQARQLLRRALGARAKLQS